jgi:phage-related protein
MADGSIILDTRVNTKGAEADLKALQAKAKSTAQQIAAVEKDYNSTTSKHSKLGEDLRQTRAQAAAAAREIQNLNRALDDQNDAGLTVDPADIKRLDSMRASLDKQLNQIADMSKEYRSQSAALKTMDQQHKQLTARLEKEQTAVNEQADAEARMQKSGVSDRLQKASSAIGIFAGRLKHIVAGVLVFNLISSALRTMVSGLGSAIVKTDGVSTAFARLKGAASTAAAGLASALAPAITWIMNLLTSLLNGIVRLISFLTGKSISGMKSAAQGINSVGSAAGSTAKKTKDAGKEAKKAAGELAAFDELNVLNKQQEEDTNDDTGGGGGGGAGSGLAYDFEQAQNPLQDLMGRLSNFWDAFLARLAPSVAAWKAAWEQIRQAAMDVWPGIQAAAQNLWDNGLKPLLSYLLDTFIPGIINGFSLILAPVVGDVVSSLIRMGAAAFETFSTIAVDAIQNIIIPALDLLLTAWTDISTAFNSAWTTYISPVFTMMVEWFQEVMDFVERLWLEVVSPILSAIVAQLQALWDDHLAPLAANLIAVVGDAINFVAELLKALWDNLLLPVANWLLTTFGPTITTVCTAVSGIVTNTIGVIADVLNIGLLALKGVIDFMRNVFEGNWDAAWQAVSSTVSSIWDVITNSIKTAINNIIGFVNAMITAIVSALNAVIDAMNSISFDVPDGIPGLGGKHIGFDITHITAPQIPYLAQGAVIPANHEFLAVLGDQSSGTNVEAPLETIKEALAEVMTAYGGQDITIRFAASGGLEQLVRLLKPYIDKENNRAGAKLISGGAY